ncbi:hypothetical protein D3C74_137830 [compost metagenome]
MTIQSIESINLANQLAIQSVLPPTIQIVNNNDMDDKAEFRRMDDCLNSAVTNKADLIELLFYFEQEGTRNQHKPNDPWLARLIASDAWTKEMHTRFWDMWDGDLNGFSDTACEVFDEFYPLN